MAHRSLFQSTPPVRGATFTALQAVGCVTVSIHAPREGSDVRSDGPIASAAEKFQSTPPVRGATKMGTGQQVLSTKFQSTPPVRGATSTWASSRRNKRTVSIHAPREGSDLIVAPLAVRHQFIQVSIHAPREGSDHPHRRLPCPEQSFNPRPP